ncbi:MAG: glycosyl hydrolase family 32 [Aquiluna sp.]|nr:glycosyl hydrolase family 32 [Micrococcales bacterium]MBT5398781.1 glycosyl hydrolase family 32 [Micrococcales bacterium]MBT7926499.1 glycosyl hydrolase family 32 [Micrococcales bacterium]MDG2478720.1 glycosyl hydrolase family 32 [Aquiluna sp.]
MAIRLADRWIWDSWYVWDGDVCHAFYLCASKGLGDPNRRHRYTNVGHAVSKDLTNWTVLPDALSPSDSPAFDSWTVWTGSVVKADDGTWWMFYTGTSREDGGDIQKIGAATSTDLISWVKHPNNPLVEADSTWYELLDKSVWHDQAWRDPWVFKNEAGLWQMLITGRAKNGDPKTRGAMAQAVSKDLKNWTVLQPLAASQKDFGQLEVFQYEVVDGIPLVLFCCGYRELSEQRRSQFGNRDATYSVVCRTDLSSVDFSEARAFEHMLPYAARLVQNPVGEWFLLGFLNEVDGKFVGEICDPIPVTANSDLGLVLRLDINS